ncbi:MAG TPA: SCO family protein [Thermoanaerobaculia bacterium]|nr:SCO family protein [Thermoanaerobaculia bacterium]
MNRREMLTAIAKGAAVAAVPGIGSAAASAQQPGAAPAALRNGACGAAAGTFPNVLVCSHENRQALFYRDLVQGKTVMINFMSIAGEAANPVTASLAEVQKALGDRLGRDAFMYSITVDPERDTPRALRDFAARHGARPGWLFLTGEPAAIEALHRGLFAHPGHHGATPVEDCSRGIVRYGNDAVGLWGSAPARSSAAWLAARLSWVAAGSRVEGPPRRRGPAPLAVLLAGLLAAGLAGGPGSAAAATSSTDRSSAASSDTGTTTGSGAGAGTAPATSPYHHPHPQGMPPRSTVTTSGDTTTVSSGASLFAQSKPFLDPPGTNFLPTIYTDLYDAAGNLVPNTLPSTPTVPYNLLDGDPLVSPISPISPRDDLAGVWDAVDKYLTGQQDPEAPVSKPVVLEEIQRGIDILEGNPIAGRAYSGFPVLHYDGPDKVKQVRPIHDEKGAVVGGEVHVHQVWYDIHVESDTAFLDVSQVPKVPWTIVYTVDVLSRGEDDFSPFAMYSDPSTGTPAKAWAAMDQTFFPMRDGTRNVFRVKMAPGEYYHLVYNWGWRMHAPRAQVMEDAATKVNGVSLPQWEINVFGPSPRSSEEAKRKAIAQIGDLAPEKRMWNVLYQARDAARGDDLGKLGKLLLEGRSAFFDWIDRTKLPTGVEVDHSSDLTLFYANNTIYAEWRDGNLRIFPRWQTRGTKVKVTLLNGDYFEHGYAVVDFGGARGWENQFKSSVKVGGSGCWFTFGRVYWYPVLAPMPAMGTMPAAPLITVPAADPRDPTKFGQHKVEVTFNFDPARRLRFYQFDPVHHDEAIFSVH